MNFEQFKEEVKEKIKVFLPPEYQDANVELCQVPKNNNVVLDGVSFKNPLWDKSPVIYLNSFYETYQQGREMYDILHEIAEIIRNTQTHVEHDISYIHDYEQVKNNLFVMVCNATLNEKSLENVPCELQSDLAMVYRIKVEMENGDKGSILVNNNLLKTWGISEEQLKKDAWESMRKINPPMLQDMNELVEDFVVGRLISAEEYEIGKLMPDDIMFVLTNTEKYQGAAYMFDVELMSKLADKLGADLIVLPSSIHEIIIVNGNGEYDYEDLRNVVRDVNETQVADEELLSYDVYLFSKDTQMIQSVTELEATQVMSM